MAKLSLEPKPQDRAHRALVCRVPRSCAGQVGGHPDGCVGFVDLAIVSWVWRQASREAGGLLVSTVSHAVADLSVILAAAFLV